MPLWNNSITVLSVNHMNWYVHISQLYDKINLLKLKLLSCCEVSDVDRICTQECCTSTYTLESNNNYKMYNKQSRITFQGFWFGRWNYNWMITSVYYSLLSQSIDRQIEDTPKRIQQIWTSNSGCKHIFSPMCDLESFPVNCIKLLCVDWLTY